MPKPVILAVDDDPEVLNAVDRDLRAHFRTDYRVIKVGSGRQAVDTTLQLKQRGSPVALFLVDERMPEMSGTQFLAEAKKLYPEARKVLLTAYADTETAILAINRIGLDHYLLKPWEPPTERLYPVLDDLLADWRATVRPSQDGLRVAGTSLSPTSYALKDFLSGNGVPYQWIDLDSDPAMRALVEAMPDGLQKLPVVLFPDGTTMVQPTPLEVAERLGMQTHAKSKQYDFIVIGGGPAGLAASVYAGSEGLRTILVERYATGGQAGTSSQIENYLGFPSGVSGADLARRATTQAKRFGVEVVTAQDVASIERRDPYRVVKLSDGSEVQAKAILISSGMEVRRLDVPGIEGLVGTGVFYGAALTEAATYRDRDVYVVGGANSAGQGAMFFSRYARRVTMLVRGESLTSSMSQYLIDRIADTKNVEVLTRSVITSVRGTGKLESVTISDLAAGTSREVPADALFIFIGTSPRTDMVAGLVERDAQGFILTGRDLMVDGHPPQGWPLTRDPFLFETSVPGVFAAGDARRGSGKRVAAAVGEGSATVSMVHEYLETV
ncbi:MAG TPA: FAD-dependent oxidoreductase [Gemmatimonadaceae bacterium]|nr:FAD-dependent oxidoreductase [Gemmatimonadaceae bacterium]